MKKILCISGSRADAGLLEWPVKVLREAFDVTFVQMEPPLSSAGAAFQSHHLIELHKPDCLLILGDRWEILQAAIAAHLQRVPIAHLCGGDTAEGSYDSQMRDCISLLSKWHFVTSEGAAYNVMELIGDGEAVHMIGNIALDYIMHGDWKRERPNLVLPYVVVSYQPETANGVNEMHELLNRLPTDKFVFIILPNIDRGSEEIAQQAIKYAKGRAWCSVRGAMPRDEFLNLLVYADEFIGNSSAILYEAPALNVKCRMIGRRQEGRVAPTGDGKASERIREVLCRCL